MNPHRLGLSVEALVFEGKILVHKDKAKHKQKLTKFSHRNDFRGKLMGGKNSDIQSSHRQENPETFCVLCRYDDYSEGP